MGRISFVDVRFSSDNSSAMARILLLLLDYCVRFSADDRGAKARVSLVKYCMPFSADDRGAVLAGEQVRVAGGVPAGRQQQ